MKINKKINTTAILITAIILFSSFVSGFAVSKPYFENNQLKLLPGESKQIEFVLQNGGGATEDINVRPNILQGSEVIKITDSTDTYLVPAGGRISVNAIVSIPSDAEIGDRHLIKISFTTVTEAGLGGMGIGSGIEQSFNAVVGKEEEVPALPEIPEETKKISTSTYLIILVLAVILVLIIIIVLKRRQQ